MGRLDLSFPVSPAPMLCVRVTASIPVTQGVMPSVAWTTGQLNVLRHPFRMHECKATQ